MILLDRKNFPTKKTQSIILRNKNTQSSAQPQKGFEKITPAMNRNTYHERYEYIAVGMWDFLCVIRRERGGGYRVTSPEMPTMLAFGYSLADARETARDELMRCLQAQTCEIDDPFRELRAEWRPNGGR